MNHHYRVSTATDGIYVANNLRPEDKAEIEGLGHNPLALPFCCAQSKPGVTLVHADGRIAGVGGIMPDPRPGVGMIWLLCTPVIAEAPHHVVKGINRWLKEQREYKMLWNLADARNTLHHKLLKLLGFKAIRQVNVGPSFLPYLEIVKLCASQ